MALKSLLKKNARTLYLSARLMPRRLRRAFFCSYLLCRAADTVADTALLPVSVREGLIKDFPELIKKQKKETLLRFQKEFSKIAEGPENERVLLSHLDLYLKEFNLLNKHQKDLIFDVVTAVCRAMSWDLSFFPSAESGLLKAVFSAEETKKYCDYMGGAPGEFWAKLLLEGRKNARFTEEAKNIGRALQITNILRDLRADLKIGRCYLPVTDLTEARLLPQDLLEPKSYRRLKPVICAWVRWGVDNLLSAPSFFGQIPKFNFGARCAVAWPVLWSLDTLLLLIKSKNLLEEGASLKIPKRRIYLTMLASPLYCFSNRIFAALIKRRAQKIKRITQ